jgi:CBS domain-containing protein
MPHLTERPTMKRLAVEEIIIPIEEGVALKPSVSPQDRITEALEVMLKNDVKRLAVTREKEVLGMITLEDALKQVGLEGDLKSKGSRSVIIHGRKILVE